MATTEDFETYKFTGLSAPENRNMVLFPEETGGVRTRAGWLTPLHAINKDMDKQPPRLGAQRLV